MSERLPPPRTKAEVFRAKGQDRRAEAQDVRAKAQERKEQNQEAHSNESSHLARCPNCCPRLVFSRYDLRASAQNEAPDLRAKAQDFEASLELTLKTSKLKPKKPKLKLSGNL